MRQQGLSLDLVVDRSGWTTFTALELRDLLISVPSMAGGHTTADTQRTQGWCVKVGGANAVNNHLCRALSTIIIVRTLVH